jgi:ketosteroid isomerase-like protein
MAISLGVVSGAEVEVVRCFLAPHDGEDLVPLFAGFIERFGSIPDAQKVVAIWAEDPGWCYAHPEIEWDTRGHGIGDAVRGPAGLASHWQDWVGGLSRYVYRVREYRDLGSWVMTVADVEATAREGLPLGMRSVQLWRARDGKVIRMRAFGSEAEALAALAEA